MNQEFYTLPLTLDRLVLKKEHAKCSLQKSVAQQLRLILTTAFGELPNDGAFGCGIWDHDFDNISTGHMLKEMIRESVLRSIQQYEPRLYHIRLELLVNEEELTEAGSCRRIKNRMDVTITGVLQLTNERFQYVDSFFVGPLSY